MESKYQPINREKELSAFWEKEKLFEASTHVKKKSFCIALPPPNANADLHLGHAMYVYEDVMIRYHKLIGDSIFWISGADHAGFETQYVYEKHLAKLGKSRFDFERSVLYQNIWEFVMKNRENMEEQLRRLGFALDWRHKQFTLDAQIIQIVYRTFKHLHSEGLLYRSDRLVNYCTHCGTSFSDLEVVNKDIEGMLYYIKYPLKHEEGHITVATTRPETMFGDVAVMVNPGDKRHKSLIGKTAILPILNKEIPIIADEYVDKKFGTGAVKVTPAHDINDFEVAKRHHLSYSVVIGFHGKMQNTGFVDGLRIKLAREEVLKKLSSLNLLEKTVSHTMVIKACYRCGRTLEPLPKEQWYIRIQPLAQKAIELVTNEKIVIFPKRFKRQLIRILNDFIDWNISRQTVWGIQIPAYRCTSTKFRKTSQKNHIQQSTNSSIEDQWFVSIEKPDKCQICGECKFEQDQDTFDTWFSSAQWPFATLQAIGPEFYKNYYPTTVMETGHDILRAWVARMIMIGIFETDTIPFQTVFLHGMVRDRKGQKMSKSKGNVFNPIEMIDKYGADALRGALLFGTKEGNDVVLSEEKIIGMRNFANKLWNIGRFLEMNTSIKNIQSNIQTELKNDKLLKQLKKELKIEKKKYMSNMHKYRFSMAFESIYHFVWHRFADFYLEELKADLKNGNIKILETLNEVFQENLKMLHPFMPFVSEALWKEFHGETQSILNSRL